MLEIQSTYGEPDVEPQEAVHFSGRQAVPVGDFSAQLLLLGVVLEKLLLYIRVHPAINTAYSMYETHGVPVQVGHPPGLGQEGDTVEQWKANAKVII